MQERFYKSIILSFDTSKDKIVALIDHIASTQCQPIIDKLATLYKSVILDIYVNVDNNVENLKTGDERWKVVLIEEEFRKRMYAGS